MLGSGHPNLEDALKRAGEEHPDFFRGVVKFSEGLAHRIIAGSDILLMPSRFEPCGLNQMYAMKYGTIPVAHATGGLKDTVITYNEHQQDGTTGFAFEGCSEDSLKGALYDALKLYRCALPLSPSSPLELQQMCMVGVVPLERVVTGGARVIVRGPRAGTTATAGSS